MMPPSQYTSSYVGAPDCRVVKHVEEEELWIYWNTRKMKVPKDAYIRLGLLTRGLTQRYVNIPMSTLKGQYTYRVKRSALKESIISYQAEIRDPRGTVYATYTQSMWFTPVHAN